jgi:hypothetical protein
MDVEAQILKHLARDARSSVSIDLLRKYQAIAVADGNPFACCDDKYSS